MIASIKNNNIYNMSIMNMYKPHEAVKEMPKENAAAMKNSAVHNPALSSHVGNLVDLTV